MIAAVSQAASVIESRRRGAARKANINRVQPKESWSNGYLNWDDSKFESRVRVHRDTFEFILGKISPFIAMTPTNFVPIPIEAHRQVGINPIQNGPEWAFKINTKKRRLHISNLGWDWSNQTG